MVRVQFDTGGKGGAWALSGRNQERQKALSTMATEETAQTNTPVVRTAETADQDHVQT